MSDNKFSAFGLPENIEISDEKESSPKGNRLDIEEILKNLGGMPGPDSNINEIIQTMLKGFMDPKLQEELLRGQAGFGSGIEISFHPEGLDLDEEYDVEGTDFQNFDKTKCLEYGTLVDPDSFGAIDCDTDFDMFAKFQKMYGYSENNVYPVQLFIEQDGGIVGFNLLSDIEDISHFKYIEQSDKYILFKVVPKHDELEEYVIAFVMVEGDFTIVNPIYGNSYNTSNGRMFSKINDSDLYNIDKDTGKIEFTKGYDLNKIRDGLNLLLYTHKEPLLSIERFGQVLNVADDRFSTSNNVLIGKIKSNESMVARMFKRDFNLQDDQLVFDFYVKVIGSYSDDNMFLLSNYLRELDYNSNGRMRTLNLNCDSYGKIYVELDLGSFPDRLSDYFEN
jgi:hypothetical protein